MPYYTMKTETLQQVTGNMTDVQLISVLLSTTGIHYYSLQKISGILDICQQRLNKLYSLPVHDMPSLLGITLNDSVRLKAAFELARRREVEEVLNKPKISSSADVYRLFGHLADVPYEEFHIIILNRANRVIELMKISEGGVSGTVVDPKKIFHHALEALASSLILVHNHPSGNLEPSEADKKITKKILDAGKLLEIDVLDHVIIANHQYFSFADNGVL
jgi:DNA repair protein RadC